MSTHHRPFPEEEEDDDDEPNTNNAQNRSNPTIVTACCPDVARDAHVSAVVRARVKNHQNLFNSIEEYTESRAMNPPSAALRYTYAQESLRPLVGGLLPPTGSPRQSSTFFDLFDSMLFFLNAVATFHAANVFPLVLTRDNLRVHADTLVPCLVPRLVPCLVGPGPASDSDSEFARAAAMPYSVFMSPDMIMLKYIHDEGVVSVTRTDVTAACAIARAVYAAAIPTPFRSTDMLDNVSDYLIDHYLHLSAAAAVQYNTENPSKFAVHSILAAYLQLIAGLFRDDDQCIFDNFVRPITRFLSPKHLTSASTAFDAIHTAFYETSVRDDTFFDMMG